MSFASLPMILLVLPLFTVLTAITPARWKPLTLALGGLATVWLTGGFPALILLMISVSSSWLVMRLQRPKRAAFGLVIGMDIQIIILILGRLLLDDVQRIPLVICALQNIECMHARAQNHFPIPALNAFFCYQCDMTRLHAGPVLDYGTAAELRESRSVTAEDIGRGAEKCIRGLFYLVCMAMPMLRLHTEFDPQTMLDALLKAISFYFGVYYSLRGMTRIGQGIAQMLGTALPDSFDDPLLSESPQDFGRRFMTSLHAWTERVWLPEHIRHDAGGYFSRITLLLCTFGLLFSHSLGGILWGIFASIILTLEQLYREHPPLVLPVQVRRILTALLILFSLGLLCCDNLFDCISYYGAVLGVSGFSLSGSAGYFVRMNALPLAFCTVCLFPLHKAGALFPKRSILLRIIQLIIELLMLLSAYSELLSIYLRS